MVIRASNGPADVMKAIAPRLNDLLSRGPGARVPQGGADKTLAAGPSLAMSAGLPLYTVDLSAIENEQFTTAARQLGWRYVIFDSSGSAIALADIDDPNAVNSLQFQRLTRGLMAQRLVDAVGLAQSTYGTGAAPYEIRILEILELNVVAVWMFGLPEAFIPFAEGKPSVPAKLSVDPGFPSRVVKMALRRGQRGSPAMVP